MAAGLVSEHTTEARGQGIESLVGIFAVGRRERAAAGDAGAFALGRRPLLTGPQVAVVAVG